MAGGRIRTVKPEMLEDEVVARLSCRAFRLFVGCILLADDYGNLRGSPAWLKGQIFWALPATTDEDVRAVCAELQAAELVQAYQNRGQTYLHLRTWAKHQKVDHPGKPKVPGPTREDVADPREGLANFREDMGAAPTFEGSPTGGDNPREVSRIFARVSESLAPDRTRIGKEGTRTPREGLFSEKQEDHKGVPAPTLGEPAAAAQEGPAKTPGPASPRPDPPLRPVEPPRPPSAGVSATALLDALEQTGRVSMDKSRPGKMGAGAMGEGRCRDLIGLQRAMQAEGVDAQDVKLLTSWLRAGGWNFYGGGTPAAPGVIPVQKFVDKLKTLLDDARAWEKTANPMRSVRDPKTIGYHDCQSAADWRKEMEEQDRVRAETVAAWKNPTPEMLAEVAEEKRMLEELHATVAAQRAARGEA